MGSARQVPGTLPHGRALALAAATTVTVVAWGVLVFAAIDFGRSARAGTGRDWLFLALATLAGIGCMFAALVLASRMQSMIRLSARSSTRPLPRALAEREPAPAAEPVAGSFAEVPGTPATSRIEPSRHASDRGRVRGGSTGKRAVRR